VNQAATVAPGNEVPMSSVDVIVPCYNYGHYLEACVDSVLGQGSVAVRVLIIDDCSSDHTPEVGRTLATRDSRVAFRRHAENKGHIATYNEALAEVAADYCMVLSPDDLLTEGSLMRATRLMDEHPNVGLTYGRDITFVDAPPLNPAAASTTCGHRIYEYSEFLALSCQRGHTPIQAPTAVVRASLHRKIGFFLPELPHSGDTEIWLRMAANADVGELDSAQAFRRLHATNMSLQFSPLQRLVEQARAFQVHFDEYRSLRRDIAPLEAVMNRTIAEMAFWSGTRAFESGEVRACDDFLAFASELHAPIVTWKPWRRFRWKRRLGPSAARWVGALAGRAGGVGAE
jgi:glycosyltransferase involved in cell wall biosynthesis